MLVRAKRPVHTIRPGLVPVDAADGAHHVYLHRRDTHLEHPPTIDDRFGGQIWDGKAKRFDRALLAIDRVVEAATALCMLVW